MNGCQFTFHPGAEEAPGTFGGSFDIGPAGCGPITLALEAKCTVSLYPKNGLSAQFKNTGSGSEASVTVTAKGSGLKYVKNPAGCGSAGESGEYRGSWQVKASSEGLPTGTRVVASLPAGMYLAGAKSGEAAKQPRIESERYPVTVSGVPVAGGTPVFNTTKHEIKCTTSHLSGEMGGILTELALQAEYSGCKWGTLPTKVFMNSCRYVYHVLNIGPPYAGSMDVACTKAGDSIEIKSYTSEAYVTVVCTDKIGAQNGLGSVGLENTGSGVGRGIKVNTEVTGVKYTLVGALCPPGSGEDGSFTERTQLTASY